MILKITTTTTTHTQTCLMYIFLCDWWDKISIQRDIKLLPNTNFTFTGVSFFFFIYFSLSSTNFPLFTAIKVINFPAKQPNKRLENDEINFSTYIHSLTRLNEQYRTKKNQNWLEKLSSFTICLCCYCCCCCCCTVLVRN